MTFWICQKCGKQKFRTIRREEKYVICATCTRRLREGGHFIPKNFHKKRVRDSSRSPEAK